MSIIKTKIKLYSLGLLLASFVGFAFYVVVYIMNVEKPEFKVNSNAKLYLDNRAIPTSFYTEEPTPPQVIEKPRIVLNTPLKRATVVYKPDTNTSQVSCKLLRKAPIPEEKTGLNKKAYLTFDDGPSSNTPNILRVLKTYDVKATFFVIGKNLDKSKMKAIIDDGHIIGNHTYSHNYNYLYGSTDNLRKDIEKLDAAVLAMTGQQTAKVFRFPGGSDNGRLVRNNNECDYLQLVEQMGYRYFDWNVSSTDAAPVKPSKEVILNAVIPRALTKDKAIILMHDTSRNNTSVEALPEIIERLKKEGYTFDVLSNFEGEFRNFLYLD